MSFESLKLYTVPEVADLFCVSKQTVYNWVSKGELKLFGYRRLGKWKKIALFTEEEIKKLQYKKYASKLK